ncbi:hypothetical protein S40288_10808 [Stachybotrys chartarum IBT 40288]|nr:hypothetical protein S40288_10808 [Stachybotrys chartarum IBT 40288]
MKSTTATLLIACLVGNSLAVPYALDPVVRAVEGAHLNYANVIRSSAAGQIPRDSIVKRQAIDGVDNTVYRLVNLVQNILGTNATVTLGVGDPIDQILSSTSDQEIVISVDSILELLNTGRAYLSGRDRNLISEVLGTIRDIATRRGRGRGRGRNNKRDEVVAQEETNRRMRGVLDAIVNSVGLDNSDGSIDTQPTDSLRELVNQILETLGVSSSMLPSPNDLPSIIGEALTSGLPMATGTVSATNRTSDAVLKARDAQNSHKHGKHDDHHRPDHRDNDRNNGGNRLSINYLTQGLGGVLDAIIAGSTAFDNSRSRRLG